MLNPLHRHFKNAKGLSVHEQAGTTRLLTIYNRIDIK